MDVFTVEAYNRLRNGENFRLNLETMQLEEIPEEISIPAYDVVMHMAHPNGRFCGAKRPKCEAEQPLGFD